MNMYMYYPRCGFLIFLGEQHIGSFCWTSQGGTEPQINHKNKKLLISATRDGAQKKTYPNSSIHKKTYLVYVFLFGGWMDSHIPSPCPENNIATTLYQGDRKDKHFRNTYVFISRSLAVAFSLSLSPNIYIYIYC